MLKSLSYNFSPFCSGSFCLTYFAALSYMYTKCFLAEMNLYYRMFCFVSGNFICFGVYLFVLFSHQVVSDSLWSMDWSTPCHPVPHHLPKFAQVHVHCINDAIQPSHPVVSSSSALNLSQHQELFQISIQRLSICLNMKSAIQGLKLKAVIHGLIEKQARIRKKIILDNYDLTRL